MPTKGARDIRAEEMNACLRAFCASWRRRLQQAKKIMPNHANGGAKKLTVYRGSRPNRLLRLKCDYVEYMEYSPTCAGTIAPSRPKERVNKLAMGSGTEVSSGKTGTQENVCRWHLADNPARVWRDCLPQMAEIKHPFSSPRGQNHLQKTCTFSFTYSAPMLKNTTKQ